MPDMTALFASVWQNMPDIAKMPGMAERLTIYLLENELNQLIWNGKKQEAERVERMQAWLEGKVYGYIMQ
jgi:hypothetical protein